MKKSKNNDIAKTLSYILISVLFVIGIAVGIVIKSILPTNNPQINQTRDNSYKYINPLIDFETIQSAGNRELKTLENQLQEYIDYHKEVKDISIYYKDLNSGAWLGIEEDEKFSPASLFKVPIMIALYKMAEEDPNFLKQEIVYTPQETLEQNFDPESSLIEGEAYSLEEYIEQLIMYSDNRVLDMLSEILTAERELDIYSDLGLSNPYETGDPNNMSVKEYASFFRILYNASYLNKEMSTKALHLLSQTTYDKGIRKGVPQDITIAHKFGERLLVDETGYEEYQLHECGVIYHPQKPYILCVMTRGSNFEILENTLSKISSLVYDIVNK